ncbi:hypothetical protein B0H10DRAFT_1966887 [Mycena sp. CBHHK59/15]|nr:hypothetical protein B0H10DRAFT_1966887 [Mycena sp. CBHHK59/15]
MRTAVGGMFGSCELRTQKLSQKRTGILERCKGKVSAGNVGALAWSALYGRPSPSLSLRAYYVSYAMRHTIFNVAPAVREIRVYKEEFKVGVQGRREVGYWLWLCGRPANPKSIGSENEVTAIPIALWTKAAAADKSGGEKSLGLKREKAPVREATVCTAAVVARIDWILSTESLQMRKSRTLIS